MKPSNIELVLMPVGDVVVGDRTRRDVGNVLGLAESISRLGLLHPLVLNSRHELIAGGRRLAAVKKLGWTGVPCRIVATLDEAAAALQAERDENTCREPIAFEELVEVGRRLEVFEKAAAKERRKAGTNQHTEPSGKLPDGSKGQTRDRVAAALGVSGKTYEAAKAVVDRGLPELAQAVDEKKLSVSAAAKVANLPAEQQRAIVTDADPKAAAKAATDKPRVSVQVKRGDPDAKQIIDPLERSPGDATPAVRHSLDDARRRLEAIRGRAGAEELAVLFPFAERLSNAIDEMWQEMNAALHSNEVSPARPLKPLLQKALWAMTEVGWYADHLAAAVIPDWRTLQVAIRMGRKESSSGSKGAA